jgi:hypothetical protein
MGLELSGVAARRFRVVGPLCAPGVRGVFSQVCLEVGQRAGHRSRGVFSPGASRAEVDLGGPSEMWKWRKRVGVEPTYRGLSRNTGFEVQEGHRDPMRFHRNWRVNHQGGTDARRA